MSSNIIFRRLECGIGLAVWQGFANMPLRIAATNKKGAE